MCRSGWRTWKTVVVSHGGFLWRGQKRVASIYSSSIYTVSMLLTTEYQERSRQSIQAVQQNCISLFTGLTYWHQLYLLVMLKLCSRPTVNTNRQCTLSPDKNNTDVAHYNFIHTSTNFGNFWQKCCWDSMLLNCDLLSHLCSELMYLHYLEKCWNTEIASFLVHAVLVLCQTSTSRWLNISSFIISQNTVPTWIASSKCIWW